GTGIFLVPSEMMQAVGSAKLVYLAWVVGGVLSFLGALTYAELGAMKPEAGGEYVYMRDGYGPLMGFLYAWTTFLISKPGSIATIATGMVRILGTFQFLAFLPQPAFHVPFPVTWAQLVAIALVALISFIYSGGSVANFATYFEGAVGRVTGFMLALVAALWAYDGWNNLNMVAGEIRRPERSIPIALIAGVGTVAALYMLMNAAVQYVM